MWHIQAEGPPHPRDPSGSDESILWHFMRRIMMDCPRCSLPLREIDLGEFGGDYASVVIDLCPECEGVWLDKGELDQRDESLWTDAEDLDHEIITGDRKVANCPKCSATLLSVTPNEVPGLVIDRCPECWGFWLDPGELESIQALAGDLDSKTMDDMVLVQRPPEWSWLKWALYCSKRHYRRE